MKSLAAIATAVLISVLLTSCYTEDPGPLQHIEKEYDLMDFDRLEMGDAFVIKVQEGNFYSISARGDERNIDDLIVRKEGSTLVIKFDSNRERKHQTFIEINMPSLGGVNFSGASNSIISGFSDEEVFRISLSGASILQADVTPFVMDATLSGASSLTLTGQADEISAGVSGASILNAFNFPVAEANVNVSGASSCKVSVSSTLNAVASGASVIFYRGNPVVNSNVSGGSTVYQD